jgi:MoaA/NifB/PqqE/SkfB family radical SAM enzyme/pimeloyl-ACP methyl ester carboxylesterase
MAFGIVLIHGYTGGPGGLQPLYDKLSSVYRNDSVANITLPGHDSTKTPEFNKDTFIRHISDAAMAFQEQGRRLILIGHSTGGALAVASIADGFIAPHLLILASAPKRVDSGSWDRWEKHRSGKAPVPFTDIAKMASFINSTGSVKLTGDFPVLIMNGDSDELVLPEDAFEWGQRSLTGRVRTVIIHGAGHDLFQGPGRAFAIDIILRAISDAGDRDQSAIEELKRVEPEVSRFFNASPASGHHITHCPSGQRLMNRIPPLEPFSVNEPVFANIEITTRCSMGCKYCARSFLKKEGRDMSLETFRRVIDLLPHAYRITMVGLGEPLLHPDLVDIVALASSHGRRVGLVTNAMHLDQALSERLVRAGLRSIAFSIDAPTQESASSIRPGTDLDRVINNIRSFVKISKGRHQIAKAVFSAISIETAPFLKDLIDVVSGLGVNVMMLTDLNYKQNLKNTLWQNADDGVKQALHEAMRHAFLKKLPVLSVHGLEEFGLAFRYRDFLLIPTDQLCSRSERRTWCLSPWQTLPVDVDGNVTVCDCQPEKSLGNILSMPFSEIWNGEGMVDHRRQMLGNDPPDACRICPRF